MEYDLKIVNGTLVDGTGAPRRAGNVAVKDGVIVAVGDCPGEAKEVYDAAGAIVTPGFTDLHCHYDGQVSWDADFSPSCFHGVTTCVMGNCGVGFAPVRETDRVRLVELMEGVEDIPGSALSEGISWDWETFPQYMDAIANIPHTIDFAAQVTHDPMRVYVMGDRALAGEPATADDVAEMRRLTREALEAGAVGFSTGRSENHRAKDGSATPASEAAAAELCGIAEAFNGLDHGVLQAVSDFDWHLSEEHFDGEFSLLQNMAEAAPGHRLSISLMQRDQCADQWKWIMERAEKAEKAGVPIFLQVAARAIGVMLGLEATFHPFMGFPTYKKFSHLPLAERVAEMRKPEVKAQMLSEKSEKVAGDGSALPPLADILLARLGFVSMRLFRLGEQPNYEPSMDESICSEAHARGVTPLEAIYDALLERDGKELLYFPLYNYGEWNLDNLRTMLSHPLSLPGLSDGGAHVGTVCDASFPTFMLTHWTRDRAKGKFELEEVVKRMTHDTSRHMGFMDRGVLAEGQKAHINIIDMEKLSLTAPKMVKDLPAGGQRLLQKADGYRATFVSGIKIVENGELTGEQPGALVRLGQATQQAAE